MKKLLGCVCVFVVTLMLSPVVHASGYESAAPFALLMDYETGAVLYDKNGASTMYPSSMTKMLLTYMVFEKVHNNEAKLTDTLLVSEAAWRKGGSEMFVRVGDRVSIDDLLMGVVVQSGNDASMVLAEGIWGSVEGAVAAMNEKAAELGMTGSHFTNVSGWPDPELVSTAHDMAIVARRTIKDFPELYERYYPKTEFTFSNITQRNRNPLLHADIGADGLKTGHTEAAGYGLTGSAVQNGHRLISVVNGLKSIRERAEESKRLMLWGFRTFTTLKLARAGEVLTHAKVWQGTEKTVPLTLASDAVLALSRSQVKKINSRAVLISPLKAPVQQGQVVGQLVVDVPNQEPQSFNLIAGKAVERSSLLPRMLQYGHHLLFGDE